MWVRILSMGLNTMKNTQVPYPREIFILKTYSLTNRISYCLQSEGGAKHTNPYIGLYFFATNGFTSHSY